MKGNSGTLPLISTTSHYATLTHLYYCPELYIYSSIIWIIIYNLANYLSKKSWTPNINNDIPTRVPVALHRFYIILGNEASWFSALKKKNLFPDFSCNTLKQIKAILSGPVAPSCSKKCSENLLRISKIFCLCKLYLFIFTVLKIKSEKFLKAEFIALF